MKRPDTLTKQKCLEFYGGQHLFPTKKDLLIYRLFNWPGSSLFGWNTQAENIDAKN